MISNYLKIAIRNLFRHKAFSLINISGLAIGMASAVLIFLWIQNEMSFDRFHANTQSIYEIWETNVVQGKIEAGVPTPEIMAPILTKDVPEIEQVTRIDWGNNYLFSVGDKSLQSKGNTVDPRFSFHLFLPRCCRAIRKPRSVMRTPFYSLLNWPKNYSVRMTWWERW
jgi:hypothetical protein